MFGWVWNGNNEHLRTQNAKLIKEIEAAQDLVRQANETVLLSIDNFNRLHESMNKWRDRCAQLETELLLARSSRV